MSSELLQSFFESTYGQLVIVVSIAVFFASILFVGRKEKVNTRMLVMSAVLIGLSIALNQITLFRMPQGGSVTAFSMLPIVLCGYFYGVRRGVLAGICVGLLNLIFNPFVVHPVQLLLDYPFAFGALGFAGFLRNKKHGLIYGYLLGIFARFVCSFLSGVVFFGAYAPEGFNPLLWSIYYNITYIGAEGALTLLILASPSVRNAISKIAR
jgi:thiamine transporter